jgi:hypothetical protein
MESQKYRSTGKLENPVKTTFNFFQEQEEAIWLGLTMLSW